MLRNKFVCRVFALMLISMGLQAHAEFLRCNGDSAQVGDNKASVVQKCGEPIARDSYCKPKEGTLACQPVDEWTYNPGPGQFLTILRFENGALVSIKYGDRVN
ncbi:DUF2845 domain-containing protein [Chitinimonas sp. PSY-7]|uniref:DUF2845 domain-containing protein n=1 Tax=Chitinimonas sp. PSY-7 TaxID=3459088 RepID=UPI00403FDC26